MTLLRHIHAQKAETELSWKAKKGLSSMLSDMYNFYSLKVTRMSNRLNPSKTTIGIIGLGYVGLPLLVNFNKKFNTLGFDSSEKQSKFSKISLILTLITSH